MNFVGNLKAGLLTSFFVVAPYSIDSSSSSLYDGGSTKEKVPQKEVVVLDPGHAVHEDEDYRGWHYKGLKEEVMTLDLAKKLKPLLEEQGYEVHLTREDDNIINSDSLDLNDDGEVNSKDELILRTIFAKELSADYYLSLHFNAYPRDSRIYGMEVYFFGSRNKRELNNKRTEYLLPKHCRIRSDLSMELADELSDYFMDNGWKSKHMGADFRVLKEKPADYVLLIEFAYLTNAYDRWKVDSEDDRQSLAQMVADFFEQRKDVSLASKD